MKARKIKIREHKAYSFEGQNMNFELGKTSLKKIFNLNARA